MSPNRSPLNSWQTIRSEPGPDLKLFKVRYDHVQNPRNQAEMKAVVLETPDWVDVIAVTPESKIVFIDQYRFGAGSITTEIPAGALNPGESPQEAAIRELEEETGYVASQWEYLGWVQPNPAFQDNRCHQFLAKNAKRTGSPKLDRGESIAVRELAIEDIVREVKEGKIRNTLALLALSRVCNIWGLFQDI
jgi:8-oxo-dGTP pyrophosphatase MutT (NUDIX family)